VGTFVGGVGSKVGLIVGDGNVGTLVGIKLGGTDVGDSVIGIGISSVGEDEGNIVGSMVGTIDGRVNKVGNGVGISVGVLVSAGGVGISVARGVSGFLQ